MLAFTEFYKDPLTLFVIGLLLMILFFWYFATDIEKRKRNIGTVLLFGVAALCILAFTPPSERLKGAIDIVGGSSFTLRVQERDLGEGQTEPVTPQQVDQAIMIIERRLNVMGAAEPFIARQGADRIIVQMPGVEPAEAAKIEETLEKVAKLELRQVHPDSEAPRANGKTLAQAVADGDEIIPRYAAYTLVHKDLEGNESTQSILLSKRVALTGADVANATPSPQAADEVQITLSNAGGDKMIALTKDMRPRVDRIAIVLDGKVLNAPTVQSVPLGKSFVINGLHDPGEPLELSRALMNPLENPLSVEHSSKVSPSLGHAIIQQGIGAGVIGLCLTFLFLILYYRVAGLVAVFGLMMNGVILFGIMAMFGFTFSLPGIAGMILTIGMAVDANVLIYERMREELAAGKTFKTAIVTSYEKAFSAIFDANITSLITSVILLWLGSGTIKGFAVTLTIGIVASLFSSILVTRVLFRWGVDTNMLRKVSFMNLVPPTKFDFLGKARISAIISVILIALTLIGFGIHRNSALGIDFTGGTVIRYQLGENKLPLAKVQETIESMNLSKSAIPQEESNILTGQLLTIRCDTADAPAVIEKLRETFPLLAEKIEGAPVSPVPSESADESAPAAASEYRYPPSTDDISGLISGTYLKQSLLALAMGLVGIFIYIAVRFEYAFAIGGFISTIFDAFVSVGIFVLLGGELSLLHVGAVLTIAGYSINDTIVVFDRIRENLVLRQSGTMKQIMNEAINATLARTLLTGPTTIITVAILSIFGGSELRDFSLIILIGLVIGTFSSVFIASPIVLWWSSRKGGSLREDVIATEISIESRSAAP